MATSPPQHHFLADAELFNLRLDRDQLVKELPRRLESLLPAERLQRLTQELSHYDRHCRQRLGKRWEESYGKDGLALLERLYGQDLDAYSYSLPKRRSEKVKPLAAVDNDALVDPLQQLRERHQQIAGLQQQLLELQQQLAQAQQDLAQPPPASPHCTRCSLAGTQHLRSRAFPPLRGPQPEPL